MYRIRYSGCPAEKPKDPPEAVRRLEEIHSEMFHATLKKCSLRNMICFAIFVKLGLPSETGGSQKKEPVKCPHRETYTDCFSGSAFVACLSLK